MNETIPPTLLLLAALGVGAGLYLIQRSRFLVPALMRRFSYLKANPRVARYLLIFLMTFGILSAGLGCRVLLAWLRAP